MNRIFGVTGHRSDKLGGYDFNSQLKLVTFAETILLEYKPEQVITGMALGWDRAIAVACSNLSIPYIAAVPFRNQYIKWSKCDQEIHFNLLESAKQIVYVDELIDYQDVIDGVSIGEFHVSKMQRRNEYIVDNSTHLLALYNGTNGGTKNCCDYARKQTKRKIEIINVWSKFAPILNPLLNHTEDEFDKALAVETGVDGISLYDMGLPEILTIDVVEEIQQERTANIINATKEIEEINDTEHDTENYQEDEFDKLLYDEIANEFLGITKVDENGGQQITYPHQLNPSLEFSPYNAVCNAGKFIHVDEEYLAANLHWKPNFDYQSCEWEPKRIKDYRECRRLYLDIETTGLNPNDSRIILIGIMLEGAYVNEGYVLPEKYEIFTKGYIIERDEYKGCELEGEKLMLNSLFNLVKALEPEAIVTHNGFDFDFAYIIRRCEILDIKHPMTRYEQERKITAASIYGKPAVYFPVYWAKPSRGDRVFNDGSFPQLVDTIHLAGQHDKIFMNMVAYNLKYLAFYVGFRKEKRLELKGKQIREYWLSGDETKRELVRQYLIYDLEDQRAVTNFFLVSPWYQQMYFPLALQEICVASPARKHNANLTNFYKRFYGKQIPLSDGTNVFYNEPISDEKVGYEGGLVNVNPGIYTRFFKIDYSSMYPSIILTYGLMNRNKDVLGVFFKTIETLRSLRYVYKRLGEGNVEKAKQQQAYKDFEYLFADLDLDNITSDDKKMFKGIDNSLKVGINGGYGFLGVGFYNFNDIASAALVTAYGRMMLTKCMAVAKDYCNIVECLAPETLVLTDKGYFPIYELAGNVVNVLNGNREWKKVKFFKADDNEVWEVTFSRYFKTHTIRANKNHKWWVRSYNYSTVSVVTTEELQTLLSSRPNEKFVVRRNIAPKPKLGNINDFNDYYTGIIHGMTYSDGYKVKANKSENHQYVIQIVGNKCDLEIYFRLCYSVVGSIYRHYENDCPRRDDSRIHRFWSSIDFKRLPSLDSSLNYLYGFFKGMLAGDGSVCIKDGCCDISGLLETCEYIEKIAPRIGYETTRINKSNSKGRHTIIRGIDCISKVDTYKVFISSSCIEDSDLLRSFHKESLTKSRIGKTYTVIPEWKVMSVTKTKEISSFYCCTEPDTHRFTLIGGIETGNSDSDGIYLQPKKIEVIKDTLLENDYVLDGNRVDKEIDGFINPSYVWMRLQNEMPEGMSIDLELNCPNGAIYAPAMKNYIYWKTPESTPTTKGVYRKRNRSELQKEFPIEFIRRWAFEGKKQAHEYSNEWIQKLSGFIMNNGNLLKKHTILDPKKLKGDEKSLNKALLEANCGEIGETIYYYWGSRQHYTQSGKNIGRKSGVKAFPIRRYMDTRPNNHQQFPCDAKDIIKSPNIEKYIIDMFGAESNESRVIPYNEGDKLNELLDMGLLSKLIFTQNISKRRFNIKGQPCKCLMVDNGMGQTGDNVTFYWASIQKRTPTGKLSAKCDRFPVRVIVNDDDTLSINLQDIPPNIDTSLINLNFNIDWYMKDFLKIRNEILKVVDKEVVE